MKTIYLAAALVLASSAAHAGSSIAFDFDGHKIRVTIPRNCQSLSCLQISGVNLNSLKSGKIDDDDDAPANANTAPNAPVTATAPATSVPAAPAAQHIAQSQASVSAPAAQVATAANPPVAQEPVTTPTLPATSAPSNSIVAAAAPAPVAAPAPTAAVAAPAPDPNSPLGLWATEDDKGNVRIEPCGQNICGYAEKSGEKILINMKPKENKWVGRIHDPDGGSNYDSTIALKGPNTLKVQGCAFGGLFCGGQTWKRVS
jgi:uncharacterized protein (DUF2147 family)